MNTDIAVIKDDAKYLNSALVRLLAKLCRTKGFEGRVTATISISVDLHLREAPPIAGTVKETFVIVGDETV